jgi:hypothetical protein
MGHSFKNERERREYFARVDAENLARSAANKQRKEERRMELAAKIAMVVIDKINRDIIRPGPDPEERECYDMSQELRDVAPDLQAIIAQVLAVDSRAKAQADA